VPIACHRLVEVLESLCPTGLAESWDNVGLLLPPPNREQAIRTVLLCIDLSEQVLEEAAQAGAGLVVAYHPPLFSPQKRFDPGSARDRTTLRAIREGIAVWSPHTALDAIPGGVNDWLAEGIGAGEVEPIHDSASVPEGFEGAGAGRLLQLSPPTVLSVIVERLKEHLGVSHLRVAMASTHAGGVPITSVALCAGAGGSLFAEVDRADLYVTGEMRHHDVLVRLAQGSSVVLSEHTHTERGYLPRFAHLLDERLEGAVEILVSARDRDPLVVV
jgi:dinuclear metal center YbgI/SA1388 family protein